MTVSDSQAEMSASRLRQSIFPNIPPYLTFISPEERYQEGEECPEELVIHYTVAQWTSNTVRDTIERFGVVHRSALLGASTTRSI